MTELKNTENLYRKVRPEGLSATLDHARSIWETIIANRPFTYSFLDERIKKQYDAEAKLGKLFTGFTGLSIFIACLGLFGLSTLDAERRKSEVGIRKVLGASVRSVFGLIVMGALKLVGVAYLVATPIAWFGLESWLVSFPYRTELDPLSFLTIGLLAGAIAVLTVSYQTLSVATTDPAQVLRSE